MRGVVGEPNRCFELLGLPPPFVGGPELTVRHQTKARYSKVTVASLLGHPS